jgi:hypothetical protein
VEQFKSLNDRLRENDGNQLVSHRRLEAAFNAARHKSLDYLARSHGVMRRLSQGLTGPPYLSRLLKPVLQKLQEGVIDGIDLRKSFGNRLEGVVSRQN